MIIAYCMVLTWTQALFGTENSHYGSRISDVDNDDDFNFFFPVGDVKQDVDSFGV